MFKSKRELAQALIEGRRFKTPEGCILYYDENEDQVPFRSDCGFKTSTTINDSWDKYTEVTELKEWYEKKPFRPTLCWVSDDNSKDKELMNIVTEYIPDMTYPFKCNHIAWQYATPLTAEEVEKLIYREDEK